MVWAIALLLPGVCLLFLLDIAVSRISEGSVFLDWLGDHVAVPLARIGLLLAFIAAGYPEIYNIPNPPLLSDVLSADSLRISHLINVAFVLGLLLPALPVINRFPAPTVSLQGLLAVTLLFSWATEARSLPLFPGLDVLLICVVLGLGGYWLCKLLLQKLLANNRHLVAPLLDICLILTQAPAIWFYANRLGQ